MTDRTHRKSVLLGTALTLSMAGAAGAATNIDLNDDVVRGLTEECQTLATDIRDRDGSVPDDRSEMILNALNGDDPQACARATEVLASAQPADREEMTDEEREKAEARDSERETETETAQATERVELQEEATIEGEAAVVVPEPQVDVAVAAPEVTVRKAQPEVSVTNPAPTIQVEQPQPNVAVEIPEIAVRVEIPAPKIYVQTEDPTVDLASADPQVEVVQGEPKVTVRQPDPELKVDLGIDEDGTEAEAGEPQMASDMEADDGEMNRGGDVSVAGNEPKVEIVQPEGEPQVAVNSSEPKVEFKGSEPKVTVNFTQEPTVEIAQTGEASVTFETAEEREARMNEQSGDEPRQQAEAETGAGDQPADAAEGEVILVGDLLGYDVIGADGEELGEPEAMIEREGRMMLVIEEGGFLGLGENAVGVPLERVSFHREEEELRLQSLSEEEIEDAGDFSYDVSEEVEMEREIRVN